MQYRTVRFGEFEFNFESRELKKSGNVLELSLQATNLLELFLEEHGKLLTHEDIRQRLWPKDTHVQFPMGIRRSLSELRGALGDDPSRRKSVYIRTEWAQGYRFIAPITSVGSETEPIELELPMDIPTWDSEAIPFVSGEMIAFPGWLHLAMTGAALVALAVVLVKALQTSAYGLAIGSVVLLAVLIATASNRRATIRAWLGVLGVTGMAYIASASTMPAVMSYVRNADTLPPALVYPAVTGLKFIPLCVLIVGFWVLFAFFDDSGFREHAALRTAYLFLGPAFLGVTALSLLQASADYQIFQAHLPGSWILVAGYSVILAINVAVWIVGYRLFNRDLIARGKNLFIVLAVAYVPIAVAAAFVDQQYNEINQVNLDVRRPVAYKAENPDAIKHVADLPLEVRKRIGPPLANLLNSAEFEYALKNQPFYKQSFDEPFQLAAQAVILGYRKPASARFEIVRLPKELAAALRFEPVGRPGT